jgi:tight adherence protein B
MHYFLLILAALAVALMTAALQKKVWYGVESYRQVFTQNAQTDFRSMFLFFDVSVIWPFVLTLSVVLAGLVWALTSHLILTLTMLILCWVSPQLLLKWAQNRRIKLFEKQLPDALFSLSSNLRAGASVSVALSALLEYSEAPLSEEFSLIEREQRLGVTFADAFKHLSVRMKGRSVQKIVAAVLVSYQTGGELAQTLDLTAHGLQADLHAQERLQALTAQGVMQAWVMAAMPIGLALTMHQLDETFSDHLLATTIGQSVLLVIVLLEMVGLWWLSKINKVSYA